LLQAGDAATRLYVHTEARSYYLAALECLEHLPDELVTWQLKIDATLKLVSISSVSEEPERSLARLEETARLLQQVPGPDGVVGSDRLRLAWVYLWMGRANFLRNRMSE